MKKKCFYFQTNCNIPELKKSLLYQANHSQLGKKSLKNFY
jgi:hypothetical protein